MNVNTIKIRVRTPERPILLENGEAWLAEDGEQLVVESGAGRKVSAMTSGEPTEASALVVVRDGVAYQTPFEKFVDFIDAELG